jgi:hypothetical protein
MFFDSLALPNLKSFRQQPVNLGERSLLRVCPSTPARWRGFINLHHIARFGLTAAHKPVEAIL